MKNHLTLGYIVVTIIAGVSLLLLDAAGVFIYFSYAAPILVAASVILGGLWGVGALGRPSRGLTICCGLASLALVALALMIPFLATSQRKDFFLRAQSLEPGMALPEVRHYMAPYPSFEKYVDSITFFCRSGPDTVDAVVIRLTNDGTHVTSLEYSPD